MKAFFSILFLLFFLGISAQNIVGRLPISDTVYYRTFGGFNLDEARDIVELGDKGFLLSGTTSSFGDGSTSFYLVRTDSMGNFKWSKTYGGTNNDWCRSMEKLVDGNILLSGYSNSFSNFDYDGYMVKVDTVGNLIWQKTIGENDWDFFYGSSALPDSGFVLAGETYSNTLGGTDAYLCRVNKNGDTLWTKKYSTINDELYSDVIAMGSWIFACGKVFHPDSNKVMALISKYDMQGNLVDTLFYGNEPLHNFRFNFINQVNPSQFVVGGEKMKFSGPNPSASLLMKIDTNFFYYWDTYSGYQSQKDCVYGFETSYGDVISLNIQNVSLGGKATYLLQLDFNANYVDGGTQDGGGNDYLYKGIVTSNNRMAFVGHTSTSGAGSSDFWLVIFKKDSIYFDTKINLINYTDTLPLSLLGLDESDFKEIKLFPNPVIENQNLVLEGVKGHFDLEILSHDGRSLIKRSSLLIEEPIDLNVPSLEPGIYFLRLVKSSGIKIIPFVILDN